MSDIDPKLTLHARAAELHGAIESAAITDRQGAVIALESGLTRMTTMLGDMRRADGMLYVIGNGGSAAIASHSVTDFLHLGRLRATTVHDSALLTCMSNDYGYEQAYARILAGLARSGDVLIAISSSGRSPNIRNAATAARDAGGMVMTLTGFASDNPLRAMGDVNVWLESSDYGIVEIGHQFVLHNLANRLAQQD